MPESPKLTLALCCYKFERFVTEAVEGAFSQTYRPLEIVISDDHSPDSTWDRIVDVVKRRGGLKVLADASWQKSDFCGTVEMGLSNDLTLVLNRNEKNLGLALHENKLFELSHGEWIAFQAGDDVSLPNRMEVIAQRIAVNPQIRCLHCNTDLIDAQGAPFKVADDFKKKTKGKGSGLPNILGASAVYHKDVYRQFGPLGANVGNEDHVLPLRASLLGKIEWVQTPLLRYRKHGDNASGCFSTDPDSAARYRLKIIHSYYQELDDLHTAEEKDLLVRGSLVTKFRKLLKREILLQWSLGHWVLHPEMRWQVIRSLLTSPSMWFVFAKRFLQRILP